MMSCSVPSFRLANVCEIHISTINSIGFDNFSLHLKARCLQGYTILSTSPQGWCWSQSMIFIPVSPMLCLSDHGVGSRDESKFFEITLLAKKVVTPPLKTIKPMWIEFLCFHLAEIGMIWTRDCSPTKSDTTLGRHSMQGQVGSSSSETTVQVVVPPNQSSHCDNFESIFAYFFKSFSDCSNNTPSNPYGY